MTAACKKQPKAVERFNSTRNRGNLNTKSSVQRLGLNDDGQRLSVLGHLKINQLS